MAKAGENPASPKVLLEVHHRLVGDGLTAKIVPEFSDPPRDVVP